MTMMYISLKHNNILSAFIVCTLYILVTTAKKPNRIDYETPHDITEDYDDYFSRKLSRFNTRKLNVKDYYISIYNGFHRRIPWPKESYEEYTSRYNMTKNESIDIQKDAVKKSTLIETKHLQRKMFKNDNTYHATSSDYYEMNKNYVRVVAIKAMLGIMSLLDSNNVHYDRLICKAIDSEVNLPLGTLVSEGISSPILSSMTYVKSRVIKQQNEADIPPKKMKWKDFKENFKYDDFASNAALEVLPLEQFNNVKHLITFLPTEQDTSSSYNEKYIHLVQFIDTLRKNSRKIINKPNEISRLTDNRVQALRSKYPLKNESYNFYMVRSKVYGFTTLHFKLLQPSYYLFLGENEEDLGSLFGMPKKEMEEF